MSSKNRAGVEKYVSPEIQLLMALTRQITDMQR